MQDIIFIRKQFLRLVFATDVSIQNLCDRLNECIGILAIECGFCCQSLCFCMNIIMTPSDIASIEALVHHSQRE